MLQAGPGSGANPKEIKQRLKTGLDCLKKGLAILQVINSSRAFSIIVTLFQLQPEGSFERQIVEGSKKSLTDLTAFVDTITQQL